VSAADTPEPPPREGTGDVWAEVIFGMDRLSRWLPRGTVSQLIMDMCDRRRFGIAKYGTPLQRDNARNHDADAYAEALDMVAYTQAGRAPWWMRWGARFFAWAIRRRLPKETR